MVFSHAERLRLAPGPSEVLTRFIRSGGEVQVFPPEHELIRTVNTPDGKQIHCYGVALQVPLAIRRRQMDAAVAARAEIQRQLAMQHQRRRPLITKATIMPKPIAPNTSRMVDNDIAVVADDNEPMEIGNMLEVTLSEEGEDDFDNNFQKQCKRRRIEP